jgi:hypothetical protein
MLAGEKQKRKEAVAELTLKQFPNVRRVIVSLNGNATFADAR